MIEVRDHISHKTSRARVQLQLRRSGPPLVVYALGLALFVGCMLFIASHLPGGGGLTSTRTVRLFVPDATGVVPGRDDLRFKGIPSGTITAARLVQGHALLTVKIDRKRGPIYRDARAELRPGTPLQNMYLDIVDRGTPGAGSAEGGPPLPLDQATSSVNVSDVLQTFDADTRVRLRALLDQFGNGLDRQGASLRTAFVELVPLLRVARRFADQVAIRDGRTRRLVHNFALLTGELGRRERELRTLVTNGGTTLSTLEAGSSDLDATLRALPAALARLQTSFAALRTVLPDVNGAVRGLGPVAAALPDALTAVRKLSDDATPAVRTLQPSVRSLVPLARQLEPLSSGLATAISNLTPQVGAVDHATASFAKCGYVLSRFFNWTQSVFALGDAHGEAPRGDAAIGIDTPGFTPAPRVSASPACAGGQTLGGAPPKEVHP